MVELEDVSVVYSTPRGCVPAVADITMRFERGGIHAIIGASGSGKTSLVQAMAGLAPLSSGRIRIAGQALSGIRPGTAVIFQDFGLLPWKTVLANAELPLRLRGMPARERRSLVMPILAELGLDSFVDLFPARLSGGMKQRLAVARALVSEPDLLLMDEPFSSLDALTRESLQETLKDVHARHGATMILVTHSIEEAAYLADTVTVMTGQNPGRMGARLAAWRSGGGAIPSFRSSPDFLARTTAIRGALEAGCVPAPGAPRAPDGGSP